MPVLKKSSEKLYFSIGEVAKIMNVNTSLIRYWEKEFEAIKPRKNRKGDRLFTQQDINIIKNIHQLVKVDGLKLEGAKKALKLKSDEVDIKTQLIEIKTFLQYIQAAIV